MCTYYLYIKTHTITGLKYLGQTTQDPFKYKGSGVRWLHHINKHGYNVDTNILLETTDKEELANSGIYYSELWNVVRSNDWANIMIENASGGDTITHNPNREQICEKISIAATLNTAKRIEAGTHNFITNNPVHDMLLDGTHNFFGGEIQRTSCLKLVAKGKHHFQNKNEAQKRIDKLMADGLHACQVKHICPHCNKVGGGNSMKRWHFDKCKQKK
jgi:hypothetical protein